MNNKGLTLFILSTRIIMGLRSTWFFFFWICLELNSLIFCYILNIDKISNGSLTAIKYFLVQAIRSSIFFARNIWEPTLITLPGNNYLGLIFAIYIKLGIFPCHYWLLSIRNSLRWINFIILITAQKIIPLFFAHTLTQNSILLLISFLGIISRSLSCFIVSSIQKILVYSSVFSLSWITILTSKNLPVTLIFFASYSFLIILISSFLAKLSAFYTHQLIKKSMSHNSIIIFLIITCRIGGFPPRIGFLIKLTLIKEIIFQEIPLFFISSCVISSVLILRYYIYFNLVFLPWHKSSFLIKSPSKFTITPWFILSINFISTLIFFTLYNPYKTYFENKLKKFIFLGLLCPISSNTHST